MDDFMDAVFNNRNAKSDFELAAQIIEIVYAAYCSYEEGRRIYLH